jgi:hypothetical protein
MTRTPLSPPVHRRTVGPALAVLTVILALVWVTELGLVFATGIVATIADADFDSATLLVPGFLAVPVLSWCDTVRHIQSGRHALGSVVRGRCVSLGVGGWCRHTGILV